MRRDVGPRLVRAGGFALAGFFAVVQFFPNAPDDPVVAPIATLIAALFLALTATAAPGVVAGAAAGVAAGAAAFVVLPFERMGAPLAHGLPGHGRWLALVVFALPIAAALVTGTRTLRADAAVVAALTAGAVGALIVAELGLGAIVLFPHSVPDIVGPVMVSGTTNAQRLAANSTEASDPYAGLLAFGLLLTTLLWVTVRPPVRAGSTVILLFALGVPPIWLASVNPQFPGSAAIASCTAFAVVGALVTTRPGPRAPAT